MIVMPTVESLDLSALLQQGDQVVIGQLTAEPQALLQQLCHIPLPPDLSVFIGAHVSGVLNDLVGVSMASYGAMFANAALVRKGKLAIHPLHYSELPRAVSTGVFQADVVLIQVAHDPTTDQFYWSASHDYMAEACAQARLVIALCNRQAPVVQGAALPKDLRIDYMVHVDTALHEFETPIAQAVEQQLSARVAGLVEDGCTLQTGIGSLSDAVFSHLEGHRNLGIHSGVIGDAVRDLMQNGVIDNTRKSFDKGVSVAGVLMGTRSLYEWAHHNQNLKLAPISYTHAASVLANLHCPVAINGALQVDLLGQVNSETAGMRYLGGSGGLADIVRGVRAAQNGKSIICLRSTFKSSTSRPGQPGPSTIVPRLNGPATLGMVDADIVVTEWGVAHLRNLSLRNRIEAMIAIAHPAHMDELRQQARTLAV